MTRSAASTLTELEMIKEHFDENSEKRKTELLDMLSVSSFRYASELERFHEQLCFMRAYPDGSGLLKRTEQFLNSFHLRTDLKKHSKALVNTGISGTRIDYSFYWVTADWLVRNWPDALQVQWDEPFENGDKLDVLLRSLLPYAEQILLDESGFTSREWLEHVKGPAETDAAFLVRRFQSLACRHAMREMLYEDLEIPMSINPGRNTPSRTTALYTNSPIVFQSKPRSRKRPKLSNEVGKAPAKVTYVSCEEGSRIINLARRSMVTRSREVDAFANASADDVFLVDCEQGLQFAGMGAIPERRHILESVYIFLILKNGVPIGYIQAAALFGSAEINFNLFETYRGADAGWVYGRALASFHHLLKSDCFVLDPYQVGGDGNTEGLKTGAWWFYFKMGYRPRDACVRQLGFEEARKAKKTPGYRTPMPILRELGAAGMYLYTDKKRDDVLSVFPLENIGLHVTRMLAQRFGADREKGIATCVREAAKLLRMSSMRSLSKTQQQAWERWSPLATVLPGIDEWSEANRSALASIISAKGGQRELDYLHQFDRHKKLRQALRELAHTKFVESN